MRPILVRMCRHCMGALAIVILTLAFVVYPGTALANVDLSLRTNLWEIVPRDDPVYEDLAVLADLGVISLPEGVRRDQLTRYDIANLIYRASSKLESQTGVELSFDGSNGRDIIAGLRKEYAEEIEWVLWGYSNGSNVRVFDNGEQIVEFFGSRSDSRSSEREGISARLEESRERITASVPSLAPASLIEDRTQIGVTYNSDPLTVQLLGAPGLTLNVAGTLSPLEAEETSPGAASPYSLYPESIRGLKYRIDAEARSPGLELRFSYEGTSHMPRHSISADSSQSEASAVYEISPDLRLVAGMVVTSDNEGVSSESGVDLRLQVIPMYLSASLGLNVTDPEASSGEGDPESRRLSTEIGLSGQYPLSDVTMFRGTYLYEVYASSINRSQTRLSTGVDYTPLPGATVTAGVEVVDDPEKGLSSVKGVGLGYQIDPDTSVKLNLFHTEDSSGSVESGAGAKWGAEFQWKFKF